MTLIVSQQAKGGTGDSTAGWLCSILLHGSLIVGAIFLVQRVQLAPQSEPFTWNVAMISPVSQLNQSPTSSSDPPRPPVVQEEPTRPAQKARLQPAPLVSATHSPSAPSQRAEHEPISSVPEPVMPIPPAAAARPEEPPTPAQSIVPSHPAPTTDPTPAPLETKPSNTMDTTPSVPEPPQPAARTASEVPEVPPAIVSSVAVPSSSTTPQVTALAPPAANPPARADYGWLSETILRRVEELKRYPTEARVDRAEGKVVVKAVINEDGSVDDVQIFQSSGNTTLDKAAVDLMQRAAPFYLPRPLGKPHVTIKVPMSYRLDRG